MLFSTLRLRAHQSSAPSLSGRSSTRRAAMYEQIAFIHETQSGARTHLEWEGRFAGQDIAGVTIFVRNVEGAIESIRLYHRPYEQVIAFQPNLPGDLPARSIHRFSRTGDAMRLPLIHPAAFLLAFGQTPREIRRNARPPVVPGSEAEPLVKAVRLV
jgi:hypothetical protein